MNIANLELVEVLLSSDITTSEIETKTGVDSSIIESVRNKEIKAEDLSLKSAIALTKYAINQIDIKSGELLNWMKFKKESFEYVIRDKYGDFLKNSDTSNLQSIFSINAGTDEHFYGVYGDLVPGAFGQVDSRENTDEEIKAAIKKMLMKGNAVLHS